LKLKYLRLTQATFFRHIVTGLIKDDERLLEYINEISAKSKIKRSKTEKLQKMGQQKLRDFALTEGEVDNIFDILEEEFPEL
jgi:hypothetical protein